MRYIKRVLSLNEKKTTTTKQEQQHRSTYAVGCHIYFDIYKTSGPKTNKKHFLVKVGQSYPATQEKIDI